MPHKIELYSYNEGFYISDVIKEGAESIEKDGKTWPVKDIIHLPFSLMGIMQPMPGYVSGDPIRYGTMFYFPKTTDGNRVWIESERGDKGGLWKQNGVWTCWIS